MRSVVIAALMVCVPAAAGAQGGILLQGVVDVEAWKTDTMSNALRRNNGDPGALYRLRLWTAVEPARGLFIFANAMAEGGGARQFDGPGTTVTLEQGGVRLARHRAFVVNAGRMIHPLGAFGGRVLSTRNPLIGIPDAYLPVYPVGVMVSGEGRRMDYRMAALSLPPTHRGYVPRADARARGVFGVGYTPIAGLRIGASATEGAYLNGELSASQLDGRAWHSYRQRVAGLETQIGVGHFDLRAEYVTASFEVPRSGSIAGQAGYAEARATVTPRVFVAARAELNRYPFIRPVSETAWISRLTELRGIEAGGGYRFGANTLMKATVSADHWVVTPENAGFVRPGGKAVAIQFTRQVDVGEMVARR